MKTVDLHTHSTASDGTLTPEELVDHAVECGLSAIAITDHDTVGGVARALKQAEKYEDFELIPGIEYSTVKNGKDVHIVGLFVNYDDPDYVAVLNKYMQSRIDRNIKICEKLTAAGLPITFDELTAANPGAVITRAHFGKMLLAKGYVTSIKEVFDRYLGDTCPCYVPRQEITPEMAVSQILENGGLPILAHPMIYGLGKDALDNLVKSLKEVGLVGIEALYGTYTNQDERDVKKLAEKYNLIISGGSDFHGTNKPTIELGKGTGRMVIPYDVLENIRNVHERMRQY